ncbi:acetolactate synthase [Aspergillus novofumigatus IBT 16806]|uniref:Acetolactate synthase n=1 Tax=Aspergillus novofumigatus (strain IBT 16806) TaxID=1392255 RepID=A0A2I1CFD0_ASPN1|nr:acetolactate synthase [Aspergillus novofumigatus IBT 16806]PKX96324.1 acetolactate synthase [Aspergillus novofumigatus IBT 16806]
MLKAQQMAPTAKAFNMSSCRRGFAFKKPNVRRTFSVVAQSMRASPAAHFNTSNAQSSNPRQSRKAGGKSFLGMTGGQIFHEMMRRHGVKHIFGYPGGTILPVFDAIYNSPHFDFILPNHEQGAGHMAEGYARASGKPGIVLVTSGPGATNVVTPMQDALSDGTPIIVFCGQVSTSAIGSDGFQEADMLGISRSCTKWNVMVKHVSELPQRINEAFQIATSGRPGPVLVDLPKDVTAGSALAQPSQATLSKTFHRIAEPIDVAKRPVIYAGQGVVSSPNGSELLRQLADRSSIPVTTTLHGLGEFDELGEKSLHMLGMHGSAYANMAMQEADLILALGARFDDRVTLNTQKFAPAAKAAAAEGRGGIVHFDITPKNINKVVQATEAVVGDVSDSLAELLPHVKQRTMAERREWFEKIQGWKSQWPPDLYKQSGARPYVIQQLSKLTADRKHETIVPTGQFRWRYPRTMITSGGLGTMGYGLPAAIGAKVARPEALVVDIDGDASFAMSLTELSTAAQFDIVVKIVILNNEEQGMVTQWQKLFYEERYAHTHPLNPDFMEFAKAMHVQHRRISEPDDVADSLRWLINTDGPALLEVITEKKVPVFPMVPAGCALHEFNTSNAEKGQGKKKSDA